MAYRNNKAKGNKSGSTGNGKRSGSRAMADRNQRNEPTQPTASAVKSGGSKSRWFNGSNPIIRDSARISVHNNLGIPLSLTRYDTSATGYNDGTVDIPGIMIFETLPTFGTAKDWNDPINIAARQIYTYVRHVQSGHSNYDAANLMMYFCMMDGAYTYHMHMVRLYGLMRSILMRNRYIPVRLIEALGADYTDLATNMTDFRAYINLYAVRLNSMAVPNVLPIMQRHASMFSSVYADSDTDKCQMYAYKPAGYWAMETNPDNSELKFWNFQVQANGLMKLSDIIATGNNILDGLLNREDWNIMSGDVMHAYGDNLIRCGIVADDFQIYPIYDPRILMEIHNITPVVMQTNGPGNISIAESTAQDATAGALVANYKCVVTTRDDSANWQATAMDRVIDTLTFEPDPECVMDATRMAVITRRTAAEENVTYEYLAMGTEMVIGIWVYKMTTRNRPYGASDASDNTLTPEDLLFFDYAPFVLTSESGLFTTKGSMTNVTVVSAETLRNIHQAALFAMYGLLGPASEVKQE